MQLKFKIETVYFCMKWIAVNTYACYHAPSFQFTIHITIFVSNEVVNCLCVARCGLLQKWAQAVRNNSFEMKRNEDSNAKRHSLQQHVSMSIETIRLAVRISIIDAIKIHFNEIECSRPHKLNIRMEFYLAIPKQLYKFMFLFAAEPL